VRGFVLGAAGGGGRGGGRRRPGGLRAPPPPPPPPVCRSLAALVPSFCSVRVPFRRNRALDCKSCDLALCPPRARARASRSRRGGAGGGAKKGTGRTVAGGLSRAARLLEPTPTRTPLGFLQASARPLSK
jgi:hypothetical protein